MRRVERREWLLWSSAILVTLLLTLGILSFSFPMLREYAGGLRLAAPERCHSRSGRPGAAL